jgi:flavin reductase (DIM6/NTAB) family NADH-FMN oxidoreductase RutF
VTDDLLPPERVEGRDRYDALVAAADTTLVVVTATYRGERGGCLVGFHCQCSIEPARHAIWLSKANHTCRVALQASHLGVHFLGREDRALAQLFGESTGDEIDKFARCDVVEGPHGVPLLRACADRMVGRRRTSMDDGSDHICFVVEPIEVQRGDATPPMRLSDASDLTPGHAAEERARET